MTDRPDPPILEIEFRGGATVIDFGDVRVSRGLSRRDHSTCPHLRLRYDTQERRIWCSDCARDVEGFDAFRILAERSDRVAKDLAERAEQVRQAEAFALRSIAARKIDEAWRSRTMVPACPHCGHGLFPESFKSGLGMVGKEYARARATRKESAT